MSVLYLSIVRRPHRTAVPFASASGRPGPEKRHQIHSCVKNGQRPTKGWWGGYSGPGDLGLPRMVRVLHVWKDSRFEEAAVVPRAEGDGLNHHCMAEEGMEVAGCGPPRCPYQQTAAWEAHPAAAGGRRLQGSAVQLLPSLGDPRRALIHWAGCWHLQGPDLATGLLPASSLPAFSLRGTWVFSSDSRYSFGLVISGVFQGAPGPSFIRSGIRGSFFLALSLFLGIAEPGKIQLATPSAASPPFVPGRHGRPVDASVGFFIFGQQGSFYTAVFLLQPEVPKAFLASSRPLGSSSASLGGLVGLPAAGTLPPVSSSPAFLTMYFVHKVQ